MNARSASRPRLIVTADDFGWSRPVNEAVRQAARAGALTCAGLMVAAPAAGEALAIARGLPGLQVGLHVCLSDPRAIVLRQGYACAPERLGMLLQLSRRAREWARQEIAAQFAAFAETGLPFEHVDSHHHIHIHPVVFDMLLEYAEAYKLRSIRIPAEPWRISGPLCSGHRLRNLFYRGSFTPLAARCRKKAARAGLGACDGMFGLYRTGEIDEAWLAGLARRLGDCGGTYELYVHPDNTAGSRGFAELQAVMSETFTAELDRAGIRRVSYRDI